MLRVFQSLAILWAAVLGGCASQCMPSVAPSLDQAVVEAWAVPNIKPISHQRVAGSAFQTEAGLFTAAHVVASEQTVTNASSGEQYLVGATGAFPVDSDPKLATDGDWALLFNESPVGVPPFRVSELRIPSVSVGDCLFVVGIRYLELSSGDMMSMGPVVHRVRVVEVPGNTGLIRFSTSTESTPGMSGGALVKVVDGRVEPVGIFVFFGKVRRGNTSLLGGAAVALSHVRDSMPAE